MNKTFLEQEPPTLNSLDESNTIRHRQVLSLIRLGREVRKRWRDYISSADIHWAIGLNFGEAQNQIAA